MLPTLPMGMQWLPAASDAWLTATTTPLPVVWGTLPQAARVGWGGHIPGCCSPPSSQHSSSPLGHICAVSQSLVLLAWQAAPGGRGVCVSTGLSSRGRQDGAAPFRGT